MPVNDRQHPRRLAAGRGRQHDARRMQVAVRKYHGPIVCHACHFGDVFAWVAGAVAEDGEAREPGVEGCKGGEGTCWGKDLVSEFDVLEPAAVDLSCVVVRLVYTWVAL